MKPLLPSRASWNPEGPDPVAFWLAIGLCVAFVLFCWLFGIQL